MILKDNIELVFENTESVEIPIKFIGQMKMSGIKEGINSNARSIETYKYADYLYLEIDKEGNIPFTNLLGNKELIFDRLLECNDICIINIKTEENSNLEKQEIDLPYDGPIDEINSLQKTYLSKNGNLYIVIDKEKQIFDVFNKKIIDSPKYKIFKKDLY